MTVNDIINKILEKRNIVCLVIFALVAIIYHAFMNISNGDDSFIEIAKTIDPWEHVMSRWNNWSSRWCVQYVAVYAYRYPILWRIIDTLLYISIPLSLSYIFKEHKYAVAICCIFTLAFPIFTMCRAGWLSVTVNYIWPFAIFLCSLAMVKKSTIKKLKIYEYVILAVFLLYSTNLEGIGVITLILFTFIILICICNKKKIMPTYIIGFIFGIIGVATFLICPGNHGREASEAALWLPEFLSFSTIDKVILSLSQVSRAIFNPVTKIVSALFVLTLVLYANKKQDKKTTIVSIATLAIVLIYCGLITPEEMTTSLVNHTIDVYIPTIILIVVVCLITYILYNLITEKIVFFSLIAILGSGFASYFAASLSPTLFAVGGRTAMFMFFSIIISTVCIHYYSHITEIEHKCTKINEYYWIIVIISITLFVILMIYDVANSPDNFNWGPFEVWYRSWY